MTGGKLHRAVRLGQTSLRRFRTLRLTIRDWADYQKITEAQQQLPFTGSDEIGETLVKLWLEVAPKPRPLSGPARLRVEEDRTIAVRSRDRWWVFDRGAGVVCHSYRSAPGDDLVDHADAWLHFADVGWLHSPGVAIVGEEVVAGRDALVLMGDAESSNILPGSDRYRYAIDAERGVLLRVDCFFEEEAMAVEEVVEIAFDEELPAELFEEPR